MGTPLLGQAPAGGDAGAGVVGGAVVGAVGVAQVEPAGPFRVQYAFELVEDADEVVEVLVESVFESVLRVVPGGATAWAAAAVAPG
jgi:hypothetical protein